MKVKYMTKYANRKKIISSRPKHEAIMYYLYIKEISQARKDETLEDADGHAKPSEEVRTRCQ